MTRRTFAVAAVLLQVVVLTGGAPTQVQARGRYRVRTQRVARGLKLIRIFDRQLTAKINVLEFKPSSKLTLDLALANESLPGRETTSSMARRRGALAAVNASFGTPWGRPIGVFAEDGSLKAGPLVRGGAFAMASDESAAHIGHPRLSAWARNLRTGASLAIKSWNETEPNPQRIAAYTKAGGQVIRPPEDACALRLVPSGKLHWGPGFEGVVRPHDVAAVRCGPRLDVGRGLVLAVPRGARPAQRITQMQVGDTIELGWSLRWPRTLDAVGGSPVLLDEGRNLVTDCRGYVCERHPRTGVGIKPNGNILIVTVDGRQTDSVGLGIGSFARLFKWLGATEAINLDGGGSSTMVVRDRIVNDPSDPSGERAVASALLVLPGRDRKEPIPVAP